MIEYISEYEVDYRGNIIEILSRPRTSYPPISTQPPETLPLEDLESDLENFEFCICDHCSSNNKLGCVIQGMARVHGGSKPTFYCKMFYYHEINSDGQEITYFMRE